VQHVGDLGVVALRSHGSPELRLAAVASREPAAAELYRSLYDSHASEVPDAGAIATVLATGEPVVLSDIDGATVAGVAGPERPDPDRYRLTSAINLPLVAGNSIVGVIAFGRFAGRTPFLEDDTEFLRDLADRISLMLERARATTRLRESETRFRSAFDNAPVGMVEIDLDPERLGRYLNVNRAFCGMVGYRRDELLATSVAAITHPEDRIRDADVLARLADGTMSSARHEKRYLHHDDGRSISATLVITVLSDADGRRYALEHIEDITEAKLARQLAATNRRLEAEMARSSAAEALGHFGSYDLDLASGDMTWSPELHRIIGLPPDTPVNVDRLLALVHPEDRHACADHLGAVDRGGDEGTHQFRILRPDGEHRWVESLGVRLGGHRVGFCQDVTERKSTHDQLVRAAERLDAANQAKTRFLSRTSHELRTPLNAILGYGQLLSADDLGDEQREAIDEILHAGHHLLALIEEILDVSAIEDDALRLTIAPVALSRVIGDAARLLQPMAAGHQVAITTIPATVDLVAVADEHRVRQIVANLLTNAIKYNRPGGTVTITTAAFGDRVQISVTDTGRGIPPELLPRVFEPFDRLGAERDGIEGTGIGLALARNLAQRMSGTLEVTSRPGHGSTFTLDLPAHPTPAQPTTADVGPPAVDLRAGEPLTIVYIEDDLANQRLVAAAFEHQPNIRLHIATDAASGLDLLNEHHPDVVLFDLDLDLDPPDRPVADVLREIKTAGSSHPPLTIVVGADASAEQMDAATALGADRYLAKPLNLDDLDAALATVVRHGTER
jgi:PAS domain S-box-containing protein